MNYEEDEKRKITNIIMTSFEFIELKQMIENKDKTELKKVVNEIYEIMDSSQKRQLGDKLYTIISEMRKYSEDDAGRITGIILESFEYKYSVLKQMIENKDKTELKKSYK